MSALPSRRTTRFRIRHAAIVLAAVVTGGITIAVTQPARASTNPIAHIVNLRGSAHCCPSQVVDVANWATYDGARVQMWVWRTDGNIKNQQWAGTASGWTTLVNVNAGKCLDESAPHNGATVYIYRCTGAANQNWIHEYIGSSIVRLRNQQDGRCLDVKNGSLDNGAALQVWDCLGNGSQELTLNYTTGPI